MSAGVPSLNLGSRLTPRSLQREHRRISRTGKPEHTVSDVVIDLSAVEWFELASLVDLIVMIEGFLADGVDTHILTPFPDLFLDESRFASESVSNEKLARAAASRREEVLRHLGSLRFRTAIEEVSSKYPTRCHIIQPSSEPDAETTPHLSRMPLTWVHASDLNDAFKFAKLLTNLIASAHSGPLLWAQGDLDSYDAQGIVEVVLKELIENGLGHSGADRVLVVAWVRPDSVAPTASDFGKEDRAYVDWLRSIGKRSIEIVVGDAGLGIPQTLEHAFRKALEEGTWKLSPASPQGRAAIVEFAFDRRSTRLIDELKRGTRGLYRIDRIARKYSGAIAVRTEREYLTIDHGSSNGAIRCTPGRLPAIRGSSVRLWLSTALPISRVDFGAPVLERRPITWCELGPLAADGISVEGLLKLRTAFDWCAARRALGPVVAVDASSGDGSHEALVLAIEQIANERHPYSVVVCGLPAPWEAVLHAAAALNHDVEVDEAHKEWSAIDQVHVPAPVLIMDSASRRGRFTWAGCPAADAEVLMHLSDGSAASPIDVRVDFGESEGSRLIRRLGADGANVHFAQDGSFSARMTPSTFWYLVASGAWEPLEATAMLSPHSAILTPAGVFVDKWLNVATAYESNDLFRELSARALAAKAAFVGACTVLVTNSNTLRPLLERLATAWGQSGPRIEELQFDPPTDFSTAIRVTDSTDIAVIYQEVLVSTESVHRSIRHVLRDGAECAAVLVLVDGRDDVRSPISVWGRDIPVVALLDRKLIVDDPEGPYRTINPDTHTWELEDHRAVLDPMPKLALTPTSPKSVEWIDLRRLVVASNALHLGHVGRPSGRHFTLYLDAYGLRQEPEVLSAFDAQITSWKEERKLGKEALILWYPHPEEKETSPARAFAVALQRMRSDVPNTPQPMNRVRTGSRMRISPPERGDHQESNVVIVDWGSIDGNTLLYGAQAAAHVGAKAILGCVFLCQLQPELESALVSIETLRGWRMLKSSSHESLLDSLEQPRVPGRATLDVRFLGAINLKGFRPDDCPTCRELNRLQGSRPQPQLLQRHVRHMREQRFHLHSRREIVERDQERRDITSQSLLLDAIELRDSLEHALRSSSFRFAWLRYLDQLATGGDQLQPAKAHEHQLALITLLDSEPQWLRTPPLSFQRARRAIASIAVALAADSTISDSFRFAAISVLRSSSKVVFAEALADIFADVASDESLAGNVLFAASTYARREYLHTLSMIEPLRKALQRMQRSIDDGTISTTPDIDSAVRSVLDEAEDALGYAKAYALAPWEAWRALRHELTQPAYGAHSDIVQALNSLHPQRFALNVEDAEDGREAAEHWAREQLESEFSWKLLSRYIDRTLVPLLSRIQGSLLTVDAQQVLGEASPRLIAYVSTRRRAHDWSFAQLLERIASFRSSLGHLQVGSIVEQYSAEYEFLADVLLRPNDGEVLEESYLMSLLRSVPCEIRQEMIERHRADFDGELFVNGDFPIARAFCTELFLERLFDEIVLNCKKHRQPQSSVTSPAIDITVEVGEDAIEISAINNGTDSSVSLNRSHDPRGLEGLRTRIEGFGGSLTFGLPERRWSRREFERYGAPTWEVGIVIPRSRG